MLARSRAGFWLERLDQDAVSTLRQSLDLDGLYKQEQWRLVLGAHLEYDPAYVFDAGRYDAATRDVYTWRYLPREQYLAGQFVSLTRPLASRWPYGASATCLVHWI